METKNGEEQMVKEGQSMEGEQKETEKKRKEGLNE